MWNNYPGGQDSSYPRAPPGPPPPMGFSAPGFPSPDSGAQVGYAPAYASPPPGPPNEYRSYAPPSVPPPGESTYPGQHHHHQHHQQQHHQQQHHHHQQQSYSSPSGPPVNFPGSAPPPGNYSSPAGPPPSFPGSTRPPSNSYGNPAGPPSNGYGPPPGPPPGQYASPLGPPPIPARLDGPPRQGQVAYASPTGPPPRPPTQQQNYGPTFEGANHQQQQPFFQYSQCTGKRKGLCIGINYFGQSSELKGCINDAHSVRRFLCERFGYREADIVMLTDDAKNSRQIPTRENMLQAMQWLVRDAQPNDSLFFHYSGHGGQTKDLDGDEADGFDEVIYPVDFQQAGHIVDDIMHDLMVKPLPPGCRLTAIFDSCHSGSVLDLPYIYSTEGKIKEPNLAAEAGQGLLSAVTSYARGDMGGVFSSVSGLFKTATGSGQRAEKLSRATKTSPADVISWSGCKDDQTSADTVEAGQSTGAMSYAFISALNQNPQQSYQQLLSNLRAILRNKYSQKPQLSASHPIDTSILFIC